MENLYHEEGASRESLRSFWLRRDLTDFDLDAVASPANDGDNAPSEAESVTSSVSVASTTSAFAAPLRQPLPPLARPLEEGNIELFPALVAELRPIELPPPLPPAADEAAAPSAPAAPSAAPSARAQVSFYFYFSLYRMTASFTNLMLF